MTRTGDTYTLSTGREFGANRGIIGLGPDGRVTDGYDVTGAELAPDECIVDPDECWTNAERVELADYMIAQWTEYRRRAALAADAGRT